MRFYDVMYGNGAPHYYYEATLSTSGCLLLNNRQSCKPSFRPARRTVPLLWHLHQETCLKVQAVRQIMDQKS